MKLKRNIYLTKFARVLISGILFLGQLWAAQPAFAASILFQDHFDQNSLTHWQVVRNQEWADPMQPCLYQNNTAKWIPQNGWLSISIDGPHCSTEIIPNFLDLSRINDYQVDFDLQIHETTLADRYLLFSWQDENNQYVVHLFDSIVILQKNLHNWLTILENSLRYQFWANQIYHITLFFHQGRDMALQINHQQIIDYPDTPGTYAGFKTVGLAAGVSTNSRSMTSFSNFVVKSLDPGISLQIPLLKQTDDRWNQLEYDSAKKWSSLPTISRWGCALTSMVMILHYYHIDFLLNNYYITPATLNDWLLAQPDGYVGDGNLNWLAVTRLTWQIHQRFNTPKLEFVRLAADLTNAKNEIEQQRPVIIPIHDHFIVADGVTPDEQDLFVEDPYYNVQLFSKYQTQPLAIDTFIPSYTDLSYLFLAHQPGITVNLYDQTGQAVSQFAGYQSQIASDDQSMENFPVDSDSVAASNSATTSTVSHSPSTIEHLLAKPSSGNYVLEISADQPNVYPLQFFSYDQAGEPTNFSQSTYLTQTPKYFLFNYSGTTQPPQLTPIIEWQTFREDLKTGQKLQQFTDLAIPYQLDSEAQFAAKSGPSRQRRYLSQLQALLQLHLENMTTELAKQLQTDLTQIGQGLDGIISR